MKTLVAALLTCANADETSLMQDRVKHSSSASAQLSTFGDSSSKEVRHDSTSRLLETAVKMIKNGVTPDVVTFVDATTTEIEEQVLVSIQEEHDEDQLYIDALCGRFDTAVSRLASDHDDMEAYSLAREQASGEHHTCRAQEAYACARSRRCEEQLRHLWIRVTVAEEEIRSKHGEIHDEWCVHPPSNPSIDNCLGQEPFPNALPHEPHALSHCINWEDTSPYPTLGLPQDVIAFRDISVTYFTEYKVKKERVEEAWLLYNTKLEECARFEGDLDAKTPQCDEIQRDMRTAACQHAVSDKEARERFGQEWASIISSYTLARQEKDILQMDRIAEWETLKIVQCLLNHVHSAVETSLSTGAPCPTIDSDPQGVNQTIEDCHIVTRGCRYAWNHTFDRGDEFQADGTGYDRGNGITGSGVMFSDDAVQHTDELGNVGTWPINADSLTAHLCLNWCPIPEIEDPPQPPPPACTPAYIAKEQGSFELDVQTTYQTALDAVDLDYPTDPLNSHLTELSLHGWAGCAAPLLCVDCEGMALPPPVPSVEAAHECYVNERYLDFGASDTSTFRCSDGYCIPRSGRCNGDAQCGDASDEQGCETPSLPVYLGVSFLCPADRNADVHYRCTNGRCIDKEGLCNGINNCGDGSDESQCSGVITNDNLEATSGRMITVEHVSMQSEAFHDREYRFESLGSFTGKTFIKYSNDDKLTDHEHVMTKIRIDAPMTVFIAKVAGHESLTNALLEMGFQVDSSLTGVSFQGQREINRGNRATEWEATRDMEWDPEINSENLIQLNEVLFKTYPAGTISLPGNDGGDGSFLIFIERPSETPTHVVMVDGCEDQNTEVSREVVHISEDRTASVRCCNDAGDHCDTEELQGGCQEGKTYEEAVQVCADNSQRLCTESEISNRVCCGTGCQFDGHQIWVAGESD